MRPEREAMPGGTGAERLHARIFAASATLRAIGARLGDARGVVLVGRADGGAAALVLGYVSSVSRRPLLAIVAGPDDAERLRRDWSTFYGMPVEDFPLWESLFEDDAEPDPDTFAQRHAITEGFAAGKPLAVVAPLQALLQPVARSAATRADRRVLLRAGDILPPAELAHLLVDAGYRRFPQVARPGDFSIRGGIFDIYPREGVHPYRIEYYGDEVESIRSMSMADQRSRDEVQVLVLTLQRKSEYFIRGYTGGEVTLFERLHPDVVVAFVGPRDLRERCPGLIGQWAPRREEEIASRFWAQAARLAHLELEPLPPEPGRAPILLPSASAIEFQGDLARVGASLRAEEARGTAIEICFRQLAEAERFREVLLEHGVGPGCRVFVGELSQGFRWQEPVGGILLSGGSILGRTRALSRREPKRRAHARAVESFVELEANDLVVHVSHGIARYRGIREVKEGRRRGDHLVLEFQEGVNLLVPADRIHLVQKYVGGPARVHLDRIGGRAWSKRRTRVEESLHDLASDMLELNALRAEREGHAFPPDDDWQREFEQAFPFQETRDQLEAMAAIRADLESRKPMDRLICGDVGYGKTELAMRAAFKVVRAKKQVAVLVPTTVLAQQHVFTFRDRMAEFPVRIDVLSRFRSRAEQSDILRRAAEGELDILIGTHRLLSKDVSFKDLGLIIIDEEQRFGVAHKESLKQLRRLVEILTLTATPIPRTLHMTLLGVRDISSLNEAPEGRNPVATEVTVFQRERFREIILRELNRDGQVFYVHNRVKTIAAKAEELRALVPEAKIVQVHGRMEEGELETRMRGFLEKRYNVLVTTTIIESGLDIPSVNTIVIERADRFGLSELHQLRGRVGRGRQKAYAYLLVPEDRPVAEDGRARLKAIEEFSQLGAGFQIAIRDLEIRGAGNILGREQSGHIAIVGYDLYLRLLERAIAGIRGTPWIEPPDVEMALPGHCRIPQEYVADERARLKTYRAVATALDEEAIDEVEADLADRYGELPEAVRSLLEQQRLRIIFGQWGARKVSIEDGWLVLAGDRAAIGRGIMGRGWEIASLPGDEVGGRPPGAPDFRELRDVADAVLRRRPAARLIHREG